MRSSHRQESQVHRIIVLPPPHFHGIGAKYQTLNVLPVTSWYGCYHDQAIRYYSPYDDHLDYGTYVLLDEKSFRFPLLSALLPCVDLQVVEVFRTLSCPVYFVTYSLKVVDQVRYDLLS